MKEIFKRFRIFKRVRSIEKQLEGQDIQYNAIQSRCNKRFSNLEDIIAKDRQEIFNVKAIVIQIEEELKRIEEVLKNGRD